MSPLLWDRGVKELGFCVHPGSNLTAVWPWAGVSPSLSLRFYLVEEVDSSFPGLCEVGCGQVGTVRACAALGEQRPVSQAGQLVAMDTVCEASVPALGLLPALPASAPPLP